MLTFLPTEADVVAAEFSDRIGPGEIERYIDKVETALAAHEPVHLFIQMTGDGVEWDQLRPFLGRWFGLLGKLRQLGRIAFVSDMAWLRWAARVESALLPHVHYETFRPEEREAALAWAKGERAKPHRPSIRIVETTRPDVLGVEIDGKISADEMHAVGLHFNAQLRERSGPLRLLERIRRFDGFEASGILDADYLAMKRAMLQRLERCAVVGGPAWLASWLKALDPLFQVEIRHFPPEQEALAWAWLGAEAKAERPLVA